MTSRSPDYEVEVSPGFSVSVQRFPCPDDGVLTHLPRSFGALPMLSIETSTVIVPVPSGEGFWLGLVRSAGALPAYVRVLVGLASGEELDAVAGEPPAGPTPAALRTAQVPPSHGIPGIARGDGTWWPFTGLPGRAAPGCSHLDLYVGHDPAAPAAPVLRIDVVDPAEFVARGGPEVAPLDPHASYQGRRLP